jgi:hypothetical protein
MTTTAQKKSRLRLALILAAALGSSSATLSGVFAAIAVQHPSVTEAGAA